MIYRLDIPGPIEDVEEVRVLEWHGPAGTVFGPGELIVELETHKALVEVRASRHGVLRRILCEAGSWQHIGQPLALLSDGPAEALPGSTDGLPPWLVDFEIN